jgi:hypothetical protein
MVDMIILQSTSYVAAAIGVCIAAAYYVINIINTNKARQLQVVMQIHTQFNNRQFWDDYFTFLEEDWTTVDEYREKYEKGSIRERQIAVWTTFESLGVLVARRLLDVSVPYDLFGTLPFLFWDKAIPLVEYKRKILTPDYGIWTEYLVNRMKAYHEAHPYSETLRQLPQ